MAMFQINLAKGRVMAPGSRVAWTWFLMVYLGVCGALLAGLMNKVTRDLLTVQDRRDQLGRLEARLLRTCVPEGTEDSVSYARQMSREMAKCADTLEGIQKILGRRPAIDEMLLGLAAPLPADTCLGKFDLDGQKRQIAFEIYVATERTAEGLVPPHLIALWNMESNLAAKVGPIEFVHSQPAKFGDQVFTAWKFACRMGEGTK
jgi:hypothetical protein